MRTSKGDGGNLPAPEASDSGKTETSKHDTSTASFMQSCQVLIKEEAVRAFPSSEVWSDVSWISKAANVITVRVVQREKALKEVVERPLRTQIQGTSNSACQLDEESYDTIKH